MSTDTNTRACQVRAIEPIFAGMSALNSNVSPLPALLLLPPPRSGGGGPPEGRWRGASAATHILNRKFDRRVQRAPSTAFGGPPPPLPPPYPPLQAGEGREGAGADKYHRSRDAFFCARVLPKHFTNSPNERGVEPREAPKSWAAPRGRMLPLARASGAARATERSACANRLLRARGASRRSTAALAEAAGRPR